MESQPPARPPLSPRVFALVLMPPAGAIAALVIVTAIGFAGGDATFLLGVGWLVALVGATPGFTGLAVGALAHGFFPGRRHDWVAAVASGLGIFLGWMILALAYLPHSGSANHVPFVWFFVGSAVVGGALVWLITVRRRKRLDGSSEAAGTSSASVEERRSTGGLPS